MSPPSTEDLEFQRKIDAFEKATKGLIEPKPELGRELLLIALARIAERKAA